MKLTSFCLVWAPAFAAQQYPETTKTHRIDACLNTDTRHKKRVGEGRCKFGGNQPNVMYKEGFQLRVNNNWTKLYWYLSIPYVSTRALPYIDLVRIL